MSRAESLYDVLGIAPRASPEQVEKAFRHAMTVYEDDSLATYSLLSEDERRAFRVRVQEAYAVLRDPARRHEYDVSNGFSSPAAPLLPFPSVAPAATPLDTVAGRSESGASAMRRAPAPPGAPLPVAVILPDPVSGADLRRVREARGVSLREIATSSKVGMRFLEYIEGDRIEHLPAPVYLRGFVQEYARAIGLDARRTAESYLAHVARGARP